MPIVEATVKKRDESPELPELERIISETSRERMSTTAAASTTTVEAKSPTTQETTSNNKKPSSKQQKSSSSPSSSSQKVIDIRDLTKPSSSTLQRLNALKNNQVRYLEAEIKYNDELHKLQSKFSRVYSEIFERRKQIVSGECEPSCDEAKWPPAHADADKKHKSDSKKEKKENEDETGDKASNDKSNDNSPKSSSSSASENGEEKSKRVGRGETNDGDDEDEEKGVPNFWLEVMLASQTVSQLIYDHDEAVLAYLRDIRVRVNEEKPASSYTLEFEFADNPYFRNRVLTKTFEFTNNLDRKDPFKYRGPDLKRAIGCHIDWKPKKNVTVKLIKKKIKSRNRKMPAKIITKEEMQESFFRYFNSHEIRNKIQKKTNKDDEKEKNKNNEEKNSKDDEKKQVALTAKKSDTGATSSPSSSSSSSSSNEDSEMSDSEWNKMSLFEKKKEFLKQVIGETMNTMADFAIAERFRTKLIPKAVLYMTGEIGESEMSEEEDDDDNDDEDDEDDDYYEDDSDNDDEDDDDDNDDDEDDHEGRAWSAYPAVTRLTRPSGTRTGGFGPEDCKQS